MNSNECPAFVGVHLGWYGKPSGLAVLGRKLRLCDVSRLRDEHDILTWIANVRRGENAGRTLKHVAVFRTLTHVGTIDGSGTSSKDVTVSAADANLQNLRVVAILQEGAAGRVLGVGSTRLSN